MRAGEKRADLLRPVRLQPGDEVAVVSPASPLRADQQEIVQRSLDVLRGWGLIPVPAPGVWRERGYLAGTDGSRAHQLLWAFNNEKIRGIFCLRGGYGSMRCLPLLEGKAIEAHPKVFVGYSDLTALLLYLLGKSGMAVFHGPTLANEDLARGDHSRTAAGLRNAVMSGHVLPPMEGEPWSEGSADGPLIGGCLSMIAALCGTPFAQHFCNAVAFFEDVNEPLYRLDRMFYQLKMAGLLEGLRGVVLGPICSPAERSSLRRMLTEILGDKDLPILYGVLSGHGDTTMTLPLGTRVHLDGRRGELHFLESSVKNPMDVDPMD